MSEKQKMLAGLPYYPFDAELSRDRKQARQIFRQYNASLETDWDLRLALLRQLFGRCGENPIVEPDFRCDYGFNIEVGDNFYANFGCVILDCGKVSIGNQVLLGPGVHIYAVNHPLEPGARAQGVEFALPVTIGNNVWLGGRAVINPGVTIGDNTVIASGSVVTKDIPANVLAAGVPCRVIKQIG